MCNGNINHFNEYFLFVEKKKETFLLNIQNRIIMESKELLNSISKCLKCDTTNYKFNFIPNDQTDIAKKNLLAKLLFFEP